MAADYFSEYKKLPSCIFRVFQAGTNSIQRSRIPIKWYCSLPAQNKSPILGDQLYCTNHFV